MSRERKSKPVLETKKGIELAPMVDVVFLLLAYFLINSTLARTPAIRMDLPKSQTSSYVSDEAVDVLVRENGEIMVGGAKVPEKELARVLKETLTKRSGTKPPEINIKGEGKTDYQRIINVIDQVRKAGLTNFNLTTTRR